MPAAPSAPAPSPAVGSSSVASTANVAAGGHATVPYNEIYDLIIAQHPGYNDATTSPGFRAIFRAYDRLRSLAGASLDVGCGVGFVVHALERHFGFESFGADVSEVAVARARQRVGADRVQRIEQGRLPHADGRFSLVTCFDVLEHLEARDLRPLIAELRRVLRPGGLLYATIATRASSSVDQFGENLHRTVRDATWWREVVTPDEMRWDCRTEELFVFWTKPLGG